MGDPGIPTFGGADASVRRAVPSDVPAVAAVQLRSWRSAYPDLLGAEALARLGPDDLMPAWTAAVTEPPTPAHAVLVALTGDLVVGVATAAPSDDPDAAALDGQLPALVVDPAHQRAGHGSRLLAAATDLLREAGMTAVSTWTPELDGPRRGFLAGSGLVPDGARRTMAGAHGEVVELRYAALLGDGPDGAGGDA